jgi:hypothetical protein
MTLRVGSIWPTGIIAALVNVQMGVIMSRKNIALLGNNNNLFHNTYFQLDLGTLTESSANIALKQLASAFSNEPTLNVSWTLHSEWSGATLWSTFFDKNWHFPGKRLGRRPTPYVELKFGGIQQEPPHIYSDSRCGDLANPSIDARPTCHFLLDHSAVYYFFSNAK